MADKTVELRPDAELWLKVNTAMEGEDLGMAIATIVNGLSMLLLSTGVVENELQARAHLAAMVMSPDCAPVGSLLPHALTELERLGWVPN